MGVKEISVKPRFSLFLLRKLPLAFLAGIRIIQFDNEKCVSSIKHKWINQNPFKSVYFAAMHMAAELTTGLLLFQYQSDDSKFSMLLTKTESEFSKKAVGKITFHCQEGQTVRKFVPHMLRKQNGDNITMSVYALNKEGAQIATFKFNWSCRKK